MSHSVVQNYAEALFAATADKKQTLDILVEISHLLKQQDIELLMNNALINYVDKINFICDLFSGVAMPLQIKNFLYALGKNKRLNKFAAIFELYEEIYWHSLDIDPISIVTSSLKDTSEIIGKIKNKESIKVEENTGLIGGAKLYKNDILYENSFSQRLKSLKEHLQNF